MAAHRRAHGYRGLMRATQVMCATAAAAGLAPAVAHADRLGSTLSTGNGADGADTVAHQVSELYQQAEADTQAYDATEERIARLQAAVADSGARAARLRGQVAAAATDLGRLAAQQYRDAGLTPSMALAFWAHPDSFLERAGMTDQVAAVERQQMLTAFSGQRDLETFDRESAGELADLRAAELELAAHRARVESALAAVRDRLDSLGRAERRAVLAALARGGADDGLGAVGVPVPTPTLGSLLSAIGTAATGSGPDAENGADASRAVKAVAAAYAEIGKPYVWGATGPDDFDCSGLTQHAWAAAGVQLPRTSQEQADAGAGVPVWAIRPGDLVVYFAARTHIGIYVGQGLVIHAPRPGTVVQFAPLRSMPIDKVVRPV